MNTTKKFRRAFIASLLAGSTILATGCSTSNGISLSSMNPFAQSKPTGVQPKTSSTQTFATNTKNALKKSRDAVTSAFTGGETESASTDPESSAPDPLRLDQKADVGADVYVANGRLWETTGNLEKAMESYSKALESDSNDAAALASVARLHVRRGNEKMGIEFFQRAIKQSPKDASLYNDMGLSMNSLGNHAAAAQMLTQALELAPGTSRYANSLASIKFDAGDQEAALKVLVSNNKPAVAHFNMAYLHQQRGQLRDAKMHLNQALAFAPQAKTDSSIARAVDRSREMLAQIDGPASSVAQRKPAPKRGGVQARLSSQPISKDKPLNVKPAVVKTSASAPTKSRTSATLASGKRSAPSTNTPVTKPATTKPAAAPVAAKSSDGPYALPAGFSMPK